MTDPDPLAVRDDTAHDRFVLEFGPAAAELDYRISGHRLVIIHTEVPDELEGHGLGGRLVRAAVDRAEREGLTVVPLCPFARRWLSEHPDVAAGVAIDWDARA